MSAYVIQSQIERESAEDPLANLDDTAANRYLQISFSISPLPFAYSKIL